MKIISVNTIALICSFSTLLCCVLPALLSIVAGGAAVMSLISVFPWLIGLSRIKHWIFLVTVILIVTLIPYIFFPKSKLVCRLNNGQACQTLGLVSKGILSLSIFMFCISIFVSYLWVPLSELLK